MLSRIVLKSCVLVVWLLVLASGHKKWDCVHDHVDSHHHVLRSPQSYAHPISAERRDNRVLQETGATPRKIRIRAYAQQLESDLSDSVVRDYIKEVLVTKAILKMSDALKVLPVQGNLRLARGCSEPWKDGEKKGACKVGKATESCGSQRSIPNAHFSELSIWSTIDGGMSFSEDKMEAGEGVEETDLLIYVTAVGDDVCSRSDFVMTYSGLCRRDQQDRPIAGYINFCPNRIEKSKWGSREEYDDVMHVAHELTHILGFSRESFAYFRDEFGSPRTPRCPGASGCSGDDVPGHPPQVGGKLSVSSNTLVKRSEQGAAVERVVSPAVQEIARLHYDCPSLAGAELESSLSIKNPTASHWEKRVLMTDYMTQKPDQNPTGDPNVISAFSLALLQDSGWYEVDYSRAAPFKWGAGLGCGFAEGKCSPQEVGAWCSPEEGEGGEEALSCTFDGKGLGACDVIQYPSSLPAANRYFPDERLGGVDDLMDYCPRLTVREGWTCDDPTSNQPQHKWTERCEQGQCRSSTFGTGSLCLGSSLVSAQSNTSADGSREVGCYRTRCLDVASGRVEVHGPDGAWHACTEGSGETVFVAGFSGSITCPRVGLVCGGLHRPTQSNLRAEGLQRTPLRLLTTQAAAFVAGTASWRSNLAQSVSSVLGIAADAVTIEAVCGVSSCGGNLDECQAEECEVVGQSAGLRRGGRRGRGRRRDKEMGVSEALSSVLGGRGGRERAERERAAQKGGERRGEKEEREEREKRERESAGQGEGEESGRRESWQGVERGGGREGRESAQRRAEPMASMIRLALSVGSEAELNRLKRLLSPTKREELAAAVGARMEEEGSAPGVLAVVQDTWMLGADGTEAEISDDKDSDEERFQGMLTKVGIYAGVGLGVFLVCCGCCYCNRKSLGAKFKPSAWGESAHQMSNIASPRSAPHAPYPNVLEKTKSGAVKKPCPEKLSPPRQDRSSEPNPTATPEEKEAVEASKAYLDALRKYLRKKDDAALKNKVQEARRRAKAAWKQLQATADKSPGTLKALQKLQEDALKGLGVSPTDVDAMLGPEDKAQAPAAHRQLQLPALNASAERTLEQEEAWKAKMQLMGAQGQAQHHYPASLHQIPPASALQSAQYNHAVKQAAQTRVPPVRGQDRPVYCSTPQ